MNANNAKSILKALFVGSLVIGGMALWNNSIHPPEPPPPVALTPLQEKMAEVAARGDAEIAQENQNRSTTLAVTGAIMIRQSMCNPHAFELTQVLLMGDGALCYTYRAQNWFGGHGPGPIGLGERHFLDNSQLRFHKLWNSEYRGKPGDELVDLVNAALARKP